MYPQVIEEWKAYGKLADDSNESEFASALEQGFRSAGWKNALTEGIKIRSYGGSPGEDYPKSNAAARKALELDPTLARPHAVLGSNEFEYDWDFAGGQAEYKKALELDPNDGTLREWYACDIGIIGGREQEALAEVNRAHRLDPLSPVFSTYVGIVHVFELQYDDALTACKQVADEDPAFALSHYWAIRYRYPPDQGMPRHTQDPWRLLD